MRHDVIERSEFAQINDKRFYFSEGILSLLYSHPYLEELNDFKQQKVRELKNIFWRKSKIF